MSSMHSLRSSFQVEVFCLLLETISFASSFSFPIFSSQKVSGGERYEGGWSRGSCCGATGTAGQHCPHLLRCNSCSVGLNGGIPSPSTVQLDPRPQSTG